MKIVNKILSIKFFGLCFLFYVIFKNLFVRYGRYLTYFIILYSIVIYIASIIRNKGILKFNGYLVNYIIFIITIVSVVINRYFCIDNISLTSIIFINFIVFSSIFYNDDNKSIVEYTFLIIKLLFPFLLIWSIIACVVAIANMNFNFFGVTFGLISGRLQFSRPSINPTGHLGMIGFAISSILLLNRPHLKNRLFAFLFSKPLICVSIISNLMVIYFTKSRETIIALVIAIIICFVLYSKLFLNNKKCLKLIIFCLPIMIIIFIVYFAFICNKNANYLLSMFVRFEVLSMGLYVLFHKNLLFGSSYGGLESDWKNYLNDWEHNGYHFLNGYSEGPMINFAKNPHNSYACMIFATGILGFISLLLYYYKVLSYVINVLFHSDRLNNEEKIYILFFVFILCSCTIIGLVSDSVFVTMTEFPNYFIIFSIAALGRFSINISK